MTKKNTAGELTECAIALRLIASNALAGATHSIGESSQVEALARRIHSVADEIEHLAAGVARRTMTEIVINE